MRNSIPITRLGIVDDHVLLRVALGDLIEGHNDSRSSKRHYQVTFQADNGLDMIRKLKAHKPPEMLLLDINMPEMNGYDTATWLKRNHPAIKIMAVSMDNSATAIVRMLKNGAKGYLHKDAPVEELMDGLESLAAKGHYYSDFVVRKIVESLGDLEEPRHSEHTLLNLSEREIEFLRSIATEWTYKEIADRMYLSPRTIDGYRDALFEKLNVRTRVGLLMYAVKNGIVTPHAETPRKRIIKPMPMTTNATDLNEQPVVFIGSSGENLEKAKAIQAALQPLCKPSLWQQGIPNMGTPALGSLATVLRHKRPDFAVFVVGAEDLPASKDPKANNSRDNIIFELGMLIGAISKERIFMVIDECADLHIPAGLAGIKTSKFSPSFRSTMETVLGPACNEIKKAIKKFSQPVQLVE
jgi:two-component system invasion response regulator UvrY